MRYKGGNKVKAGTYWNISTGKREDIQDDGVLPGDEKSTYLRASSILMLLLGPVLGLLYVIALPFIGVAMALIFFAGKVNTMLIKVFGRTVSFGWRPVESYLTGRRRKGKKTGK